MTIGEDALADAQADAAAFYAHIEADPYDPPSVATMSLRAMGTRPRTARLVGAEGRYYVLDGVQRIVVHAYATPERQRWLVGHELGHWWYERAGYTGEDLEARCDVFGACLVAPGPAFRAAVKARGHKVHALAREFATTQAVALLRLGEVTGRPVAYVRPRSAIARGDAFAWPSHPELVKAVANPPRGVHPVKVDGRWGLMAG
jgi:hypothetical protein